MLFVFSPGRTLHPTNTGEAIISTHSHSTVTSVPELPKEKQTSLALYVTSKEAYEEWEETPEVVKVLDVRTPEEYIFVGQLEMAVNIPLAFQTHRWSEAKGYFDVAPNPEFVTQVWLRCGCGVPRWPRLLVP